MLVVLIFALIGAVVSLFMEAYVPAPESQKTYVASGIAGAVVGAVLALVVLGLISVVTGG